MMALKKLLIVILLLELTFSMTGCIWIIHNYVTPAYSHSKDEVEKIEIFNIVSTDDYSALSGNFSDEYEYSIKNIDTLLDPVKTFTGEGAYEFYDRLTNVKFSKTFYIVLAAIDPTFGYYGYTVKITYKNGDYDIISDGQQLYYSDDTPDGTRLECRDDWNMFIEECLD